MITTEHISKVLEVAHSKFIAYCYFVSNVDCDWNIVNSDMACKYQTCILKNVYFALQQRLLLSLLFWINVVLTNKTRLITIQTSTIKAGNASINNVSIIMVISHAKAGLILICEQLQL